MPAQFWSGLNLPCWISSGLSLVSLTKEFSASLVDKDGLGSYLKAGEMLEIMKETEARGSLALELRTISSGLKLEIGLSLSILGDTHKEQVV